MKKNIYDLALIKVQREEIKLEMMLKEKHNKILKLEEYLEREDQFRELVKKEMEEEKRISPSIIYMNRQIDYSEKQRVLAQIQKIEYEIKILKQEYLRIKNRREKIVEEKEKKEKEKEELNNRKEYIQIQNDMISKRYIEREGETFENSKRYK
ncbi:hypothetical protein [Bacillus sp. Brlt_9]|uniref:hypothetical protein n=1 Tax=Bacillus sp. Brlt_9 TaxID=3110916 RepID=UPI003F7C0DD9